MKIDFKKLLPHLYVVIFFIAICAVYFWPVLEGKEIRQHDIQQWEGMAKEIADFREEHGTEPLWTRSMFGGMPAYQISVLYPANLVKYVNDVLLLGMPMPYSYVFMALLGFYILLLTLKVDYRLAVAGAIGYAFCSYNFIIIMAGHNSKMHAIALMPFVVAGVLMVFHRRKYLFGAAFTAMALALQIYANHLQITYYLALALAVLGVIELIKCIQSKELPHFVKSAASLSVAVIISVLPNLTSLWATWEYGKDTTRGASELTEKSVSKGLDVDYAFAWSYGIDETLTLLIPDFMGGASSGELTKSSATYQALVANGAGSQANQFIKQVPLYWGDQSFTSGPVYVGAIFVFLFVMGIMLVRNEFKIWLALITGLFIVFSWGNNLLSVNELFFHYVPGFNKFRTVSMNLVIVSLSVVLLGMMALREFFNPKADAALRKKSLTWAFYITGGISLLFALLPGMFFDFSSEVDENFKQYDWLVEAIRSDRESILRMDAFRSLFFVSAAAAALWFNMKNKLSLNNAAIALTVLVLVDMWTVNKRYLDDSHFVKASKSNQVFTPSQADMTILQDPELGYRVMNTSVSTFNDASTSYFHHSIGGYHGAKLKRYQELIEGQISKNNMAVLDMLNTKYIILPSREGGPPMAQQNPGALGAAWFVPEYQIVANADSEMTALTGFNPAQTAIVDKRFESELAGLNIQYDSTATIRLVKYQANHLTYETSAASEQLAVFSEIYYDKGWNAFIDGNPAPHFRVNYVLRAMRIPAGKHTVEFRFEPKVYHTGEKIALAGSVILFLFFGFAAFREIKSTDPDSKS
jgi:hypothetical protein